MWLNDVANWFHNNLGFGAIDSIQKNLFGFSTVPTALSSTGSSIWDTGSASSGSSSIGSVSGTPELNNEMAFNALEAQKARDWQEHMRDTSLTSAFNQARENGINPYVMFNGGSVSTPGASAASYSGYESAKLSSKVSALTALAVAALKYL